MYPTNLPGITVMHSDNTGSITIALNTEASENTIKDLINEIPNQTSVMFYDKDYPSPSDPGAFVSFVRVDNQYMMERSNHGWSKKWKAIPKEELENYLQKCSSIHKMGGKSFEPIHITKMSDQYFTEQIHSKFIEPRPINREEKKERFIKIVFTLMFILLFVWLYFSYYR